MPTHSEDLADVPALPVGTGVSASLGANTMSEGRSAAVTVSSSEADD